MGDHSSPRELYSLIMEPIAENSTTDEALILLIRLLQKALLRIAKKRFSFCSTAFPTLLMKTNAVTKVYNHVYFFLYS